MGARERGASHPGLAILTAGMAALALLLSLGASAARAAEGSGAIEGTVWAASSHEPLAGIQVVAYEAAGPGRPAGFAMTKANGRYVLEGLSTGSYKVEFSAGFEGGNWAAQFYKEAATLAEATSVPVISGGPTVEEIDAEMKPGGEIEGTVTEAGSATPLAGSKSRSTKPSAAAFRSGTPRRRRTANTLCKD